MKLLIFDILFQNFGTFENNYFIYRFWVLAIRISKSQTFIYRQNDNTNLKLDQAHLIQNLIQKLDQAHLIQNLQSPEEPRAFLNGIGKSSSF